MIGRLFIIPCLFGSGLALLVGCGHAGRSAPDRPPPALLGPKLVLLHSPHALGHTSFEGLVAFSPDGRTVAAGRMGSLPEEGEGSTLGTVVSLCDADSGRERLAIKGPMAESCGVAFSPDGGTLAMGTDRAITLHDPESGEERASLTSENYYGSLGLAFSPDGRRLVSATLMGGALIWDVATRRELATLKVHTRSFCGVAVSPDGRM